MAEKAMSEKKGIHYGFMIVISCCATVLSVSLAISCIGLFFTPAAESFGVGPATMSYYMTFWWLVAVIVMPFGGTLFNKLDARVLMTVGVLSLGIDLIICSFATAPWMFYVGGAFGGVGNALIMTLSPAILINRWFKKRSGFFVALVMTFTGIGAVVFSPIIGSFINSVGWELTLRGCGIAALVFGLPFSIFAVRSYPADKGLLAYGAEQTDDPDAGSAKEKLPGVTASRAYRMPVFYALALFTLAMSLMLYTQSMNPNYIKSLEISQTMPLLFSVIASFLMAAQIIAKLCLGAVGDKRPYIVGVVALILGVAGFAGNILFADSQVGLIVSGCLIGVVTSLMTVLNPILTRYVFGMKDYGKIYSKVSTIMAVAAIFQAPVLGTVLDNMGWVSLEVSFIGLCVVALIALLICIPLGKRSRKEITP